MNVKFWGTRGTFPKVNNSAKNSLISNHTSCVQVFDNQKSIFIDAGTGFEGAARQHFEKNPTEPMSVLLTHFHWDHLIGLFSIYDLYVKGLRLHLCSGDVELAQKAMKIFEQTYCPLKPEIIRGVFSFEVLAADQKYMEWNIHSIPVPHSGTTFAYAIQNNNKCVLFIPDIELEKCKTEAFTKLAGLDLVICDTFHLEADKEKLGSLGHSSDKEAIDFAVKIKAKNLALFHYSPFYSDNEIQQMFKNSQEKAKKHDLKICFSSDELLVTL